MYVAVLAVPLNDEVKRTSIFARLCCTFIHLLSLNTCLNEISHCLWISVGKTSYERTHINSFLEAGPPRRPQKTKIEITQRGKLGEANNCSASHAGSTASRPIIATDGSWDAITKAMNTAIVIRVTNCRRHSHWRNIARKLIDRPSSSHLLPVITVDAIIFGRCGMWKVPFASHNQRAKACRIRTSSVGQPSLIPRFKSVGLMLTWRQNAAPCLFCQIMRIRGIITECFLLLIESWRYFAYFAFGRQCTEWQN